MSLKAHVLTVYSIAHDIIEKYESIRRLGLREEAM